MFKYTPVSTSTGEPSSQPPPAYQLPDPQTTFKDKWATLLFTFHIIALAFISANGFYNSSNSPTLLKIDINISEVALSVFIMIAVGFCASLIYFYLLQRHTLKLVWTCFIINIMATLSLSLAAILYSNAVTALVLFLVTAVQIFYIFLWMKRIPFTAVFIECVTSIIQLYPMGVTGLFVESSWVCSWLVLGYFSQFNFTQDDPANYIILVYFVFSFYWTGQVIRNTVHTITSGVFATFYFSISILNPTVKSAQRALSTSFGSIAFGSLIIAAVDTTRLIVHSAKNHAARSDQEGMQLLMACLECLLGMIQGWIEFVNVYAFTQVAAYGKGYCESARDTWTLIKNRGLDLVINDDLVGTVMNIGGLFVGLLSGFISLLLVAPDYIVFGAGFLVAFLQFSVLSCVIRSGVATTFVCLAQDPEMLRLNKPVLYHAFCGAYASVFTQDVV